MQAGPPPLTPIQADSPDGLPAARDSTFAARVRTAVAWRWGTQVAGQLITWVSTFLVVRLLDPTDYGLFAMSQVVITALAFLNGQSFATSLVQTDRIDDRRIAQVFGLLLMFAATLALAQFLLAPVAAAYFEEPVVADMLRLQALIFLTVPFTALPGEWLARSLEFRKQGAVNLASAAVGALVALLLAWIGWGVWALVWSGISIFISRAIGLMFAARLWIMPIFNPAGAWDLFTFGGVLILCQLFWIIQSQSDIVIAGRFMSTHDLGLYSQALFLTLIVTGRFLPPINEVALAAYSELNRAKKPLAPYFLKTVRLVMMASAPIYVGVALTSEAAILTLMGDKWADVIPVVEGLALAMPAFALHLICSPVTNAMGRPRVQLFTNVCGAVIFTCAFLWGVGGGTLGLVHAWWFAAPALLAITLSVTLPRIGVSFAELAGAILPIGLACAIMALCVIAAQRAMPLDLPILSLARDAVLGAGVYAATFWYGYNRIVRETWGLLKGTGVRAAIG